MKKHKLILCIFSLFACRSAQAQHITDTAFLECRYSLHYLKDTMETGKTTDDYMILRIGNKASVYYSYSTFYVDSLRKADIDAGVPLEIMLQNRATKYGRKGETYRIVKKFPEKRLIYTDKIASKYYRYEEPIPEFEWTIEDQTRDIWGFKCFKAECTFRGRRYIAWFTPEIAVNNGPWKFHGLPGLILEVRDERNQYVFEFAGIVHSNRIISLDDENPFIPTEREKYNKLLKRYLSDRMGFWKETMGVQITVSGTAIPKSGPVKYDLMERQ